MVGNTIGGRYQIVSQLGQGGFGTTFLARDRHLPGQPPCVVKQLSPKNTDPGNLRAARRLFEREAEVLYRLGNCDRIPQLFAHFQEGTEFYLVQEFIEGKDLSKELTPGKKLSEEQALALLENILEVLAIVHQNNVIHRDIKPSNLIRRKQDDKIVLIDFGAVKQINTQVIDSHGQTSFTIAIGSPGYMPNEQMAGKPRLSSDIYAAGIVAIQALTGWHPRKLPEDMKTGEILWRDKAKVSAKLAEIIDKMVRCDFRQRYPSAEEALSALRDLPAIIAPAGGEKETQTESRDYWGWLKQGSKFYQQQQYEEAIACYARAAQIIPHDPLAWMKQAKALSCAGRNEEALLCYDRVIQMIPKNYWAWHDKGETLETMQRYEEAAQCYETAVQIKPDFDSAVAGKERCQFAATQSRTPAKATDLGNSASGEGWRKLQDLLAAGEWKEADRETRAILLQVAGRKKEGWLRIQDLENFPCQQLHALDELWVKYSHGRFGFSVQQRIWHNTTATEEIGEKALNFAEYVGWHANNSWINCDDLNFSLNAPEGHLPAPVAPAGLGVSRRLLLQVLFDRLETCKVVETARVSPDISTVTFRGNILTFERISVIQGDITKQQVDAIVNASNKALSGSAGVDRAIQNAGGWELRRACLKLGGCDIGEAKITQGYKLSAKWVIHTAGPAWLGGNYGEDRNLARCYNSCLTLAAQHPIRTIAFPGISTGIQGFPIERASKIAVWTVQRFLEKNNSIDKVIFMAFDPDSYQCYLDAIAEIKNLGDNKRSQEVDWTRLKTLLAAGKWQSADRETWAIMLKVCDREKEGWLRDEDIENFPCSELRVLDGFWVKYSGGRFGFSVQRRIWQSVWSKEQTDAEIHRNFGDRVGWRVSDNWLPYKDLNFSLLAPIGHLPAGYIVSWHGWIRRLFSRLEICNL